MNKVYLVTAPDDVTYDSKRIICVGLDETQREIVSQTLQRFETVPTTVLYVWNNGESQEWLLDKKQKCDLIIFNANNEEKAVVGYFAAHDNAYYMGELGMLSQINNRIIHDTDECHKLIKEKIYHA
jgi:hypothetical protein